MTGERRDEETGRALGRAIEGQTVRETPYAASRLAQRVDRPAARGWTYALPVAAALALFVAMGWFFARGPQGVATPDTSASPSLAPTSGPARTTTPTAVPTSNAADAALVYFARDQLPPVGAVVPGPASWRTLPAAERISARVRALWDAPAPPAGGLGNVFRPHTGGAALRSVTTTVSGDTATVVIDAGTWDSLSSAESIALAQQLVYTITEEPGIRRAVVREPGKDHAVVGTGIWRDPQSREDVLGYDVKSPAISVHGQLATDVVDWRASVDDVAPGLGRFVVELKATGQNPPFSVPAFTAKLEAGRNANDQEPGKYVLRLELPDAHWSQTPGEAFHCCPLKVVGRTPIRQVAAYPLGTGGGRPGVGFGIDLDDARPWRVFVMDSPLRIVVDIGGHPDAVSEDIAVYAPRPGAEVARTFTVTGVSRTFESTVTWRLRDSSSRVVANGFTTSLGGSGPQWGAFQFTVTAPAALSGNVTLEVLWGSPRDGSDMGLVAVPLRVR